MASLLKPLGQLKPNYVQPPWSRGGGGVGEEEQKVCSQGLSHMTIFFWGTKCPMTLKHCWLGPYQVCSVVSLIDLDHFFFFCFSKVKFGHIGFWMGKTTNNWFFCCSLWQADLCNQLKERLKHGRLRFSIFNFFQMTFPKKPSSRLKPNYMWSLYGVGEQQFVRKDWVTWQDGHNAHLC